MKESESNHHEKNKQKEKEIKTTRIKEKGNKLNEKCQNVCKCLNSLKCFFPENIEINDDIVDYSCKVLDCMDSFWFQTELDKHMTNMHRNTIFMISMNL